VKQARIFEANWKLTLLKHERLNYCKAKENNNNKKKKQTTTKHTQHLYNTLQTLFEI